MDLERILAVDDETVFLCAIRGIGMKNKIDRLSVDCYLERPVPIEVIRERSERR